MDRSPYWLSAATLAVFLLVLSLGLPARANQPEIALAARRSAEFGLLASAGRGPAAALDAPSAATAAPSAGSGEPGPQGEAATASADPATPAPTETPPPADTPAPPPAPTPIPDKGKLIFVDPGHGGPEAGAVHTAPDGTEDLIERDVNLSIALRLAEMLRQDGYHVQLSRDTDRAVDPGGTLPDLQARVDLANQSGADLFVSIHHNGSLDGSLRGTEIYYCGDRPYAEANQRLASAVDRAIVRCLREAGHDDVDRGARDDTVRGHLALLAPANLDRPTTMPAILGEALFMSNEADAAALQRADMREAIARGYFEGIKAYFGDTG